MATQRKKDKDKAAAYLKKLEFASKGTTIDIFEKQSKKAARIKRAQKDVRFCVETYLPHYATAKSAQFQIDFAYMVAADPEFIGFAEWGRGLAKSVWCNIIIPLWLWIRGEEVFFGLVSDSTERAEELLADVQAELEANLLLINDFGVQKQQGDWELGNFKTRDQKFIGMAFGIKKKVRGVRVKQRRPNLWVVDDLETPDTIANQKRMRRQAEIIERDIIPTMTGKMKRLLYANNKFARIMTQTILQEKHPDWKVHQIKAYNKATHEPAWKTMYTKEFYRGREEIMGIPAAYAEYNHETKLEGKNFKEEDIQWVKLPNLLDFQMIVVHWDIAYTDNEHSDYNAIKAWGGLNRKFYLIDGFLKQVKMKIAVQWMCEFKLSLPPGVNVIFQYESQFWNEEVQRNIDEAEQKYNVSLNIMKVELPKVKKLGRMLTMVPYYQNSRAYYNEELKSHNDTQVGILQLCAVEEGSGEHDDSPDADQVAISTLEKYMTPTPRFDSGEKTYRTGRMKHKYEL